MKILLFLILFPVFANSQKIVVNEIDKFTKQHRIETNKVYARNGYFCELGFSYRSVDSINLINIYSYGCGVGVIGTDDKFIFLLENDSTVTVLSKGIQSYDIGSGSAKNRSQHEYFITKSDIEKLSSSNLVSIRVYLTDVYENVDVKDSKRKNILAELSKVFLNELDK